MKKCFFRHGYGSFHFVSEDTFYWLQHMPYVKEESITDRIIYALNRNNPFVICHEFSRNEEAINGADWEWWVLFNDCEKVSPASSGPGQYDGVFALRCRIQAKKLARGNEDNYHLFQYANRNGLQIDLLRKQAAQDKAYAIYALYSDCLRTNDGIDLEFCNESLSNTCANCRNGIFLISANKIYKNYVIPGKQKINREDIVNQSLPASILDYFISGVNQYYFDWYARRNNDYRNLEQLMENKSKIERAVRFMRFEQKNIYTYKDFPNYLKTLILESERKRVASRYEWRFRDNYGGEFESVERTTLSGVGIIDMRSKNVLMNSRSGERFFYKR